MLHNIDPFIQECLDELALETQFSVVQRMAEEDIFQPGWQYSPEWEFALRLKHQKEDQQYMEACLEAHIIEDWEWYEESLPEELVEELKQEKEQKLEQIKRLQSLRKFK